MKKLRLIPALALIVLLAPPSTAAVAGDTMGARAVFPMAGLDLIVVIAGAALLLAIGFLLRKKSR